MSIIEQSNNTNKIILFIGVTLGIIVSIVFLFDRFVLDNEKNKTDIKDQLQPHFVILDTPHVEKLKCRVEINPILYTDLTFDDSKDTILKEIDKNRNYNYFNFQTAMAKYSLNPDYIEKNYDSPVFYPEFTIRYKIKNIGKVPGEIIFSLFGDTLSVEPKMRDMIQSGRLLQDTNILEHFTASSGFDKTIIYPDSVFETTANIRPRFTNDKMHFIVHFYVFYHDNNKNYFDTYHISKLKFSFSEMAVMFEGEYSLNLFLNSLVIKNPVVYYEPRKFKSNELIKIIDHRYFLPYYYENIDNVKKFYEYCDKKVEKPNK